MAAALADTDHPTAGKTYYFIPKDTLNPYEVIADRGGKLALTELGDKQVVSSGTEDTAAAQHAGDPGCDPVARGRHRASPATTRRRVCPALKQAQAPGHRRSSRSTRT